MEYSVIRCASFVHQPQTRPYRITHRFTEANKQNIAAYLYENRRINLSINKEPS